MRRDLAKVIVRREVGERLHIRIVALVGKDAQPARDEALGLRHARLVPWLAPGNLGHALVHLHAIAHLRPVGLRAARGEEGGGRVQELRLLF